MIHDEFAVWDAAYVLGALAPAERKLYEEHLRDCDRCSVSVTELAGMPGLLGRVPREQAFALLDEAAPRRAGLGAGVLPALLESARRRRRRSRWFVGGIAALAAAVLVGAVALAGPVVFPSTPSGTSIAMEHVGPSALSAELRVTPEPWGTRIDSRCSYAHVGGADRGRVWTYAMVVTDRSGHQTQISTWTATEGSTVEPAATTSVPLADIAAIDIRAAAAGTVLLRSTFG
jgi:RNA polymerase sigma-70 factor (ECF subfamily)